MYQLSGQSKIISGDETLCVQREQQPLLVDGKFIKRDLISFYIQCNVQPLSGLDLLQVPEGDRHLEMYWVFSNEISKDIFLNDRVIRRGISYQVQKVETWGKPPNGYQRFRMTRMDVGPNKAVPDPNSERA